MTDFEKAPPWRDEEYAFLEDHPHLTARQIAEELGRTVPSVEKKRAKIKRGWEPSRDHWSDEDIEFVRTNPSLTEAQVASALGKTLGQVEGQRKRLVQREGLSFEGSKNPCQVGPRPLLAKTCKACGYFLPAQWFHFNKRNGGYWTPNCYRCANAGKDFSKYSSRGDSASTKRLQALSLETATRKSQPWTESDHKVLADESLSVIEKAVRLRRTYYATQHLVQEHGYPSRVGLGNPESAAWVIHFPNGVAA